MHRPAQTPPHSKSFLWRHSRVVVLGPGNAGKSTVLAVLQGKEHDGQSTNGAATSTLQLNKQELVLGKGKLFTLHQRGDVSDVEQAMAAQAALAAEGTASAAAAAEDDGGETQSMLAHYDAAARAKQVAAQVYQHPVVKAEPAQAVKAEPTPTKPTSPAQQRPIAQAYPAKAIVRAGPDIEQITRRATELRQSGLARAKVRTMR